MYIGHKRDDGAYQSLKTHLEGVSIRAAEFARSFDGTTHAERIGMMHDIGKYSPAGQRRMMDPERVRKVDHSTAGAQEAISKFKDYIGAFAIAGHHGGLPDFGNRADAEGSTLLGRNAINLSGELDYSPWQTELTLNGNVRMPEWLVMSKPWQVQFYTRMIFSCLVDADYLDTEQFMQDGLLERGCAKPMDVLCDRLLAYVRPWLENADTSLNNHRNEILKHCLQGNEKNRGIYTLTVPTGGGKTISSLGFALAHAVKHKLKRVIYVIPYTSIIEQNAAVFSKILGKENVLEHHSNIDFASDMFDDETDLARKKQLATENWDAPVVVTTAVQFFESLYANKTSKCRKLHNLAESVIIFDEAQMLPLPYLRPCVAAIAELVEHYGVTAVLCTATQPSLGKLIREFVPEIAFQEICPRVEQIQTFFRRVRFEWEGVMTDEQLADRLIRSNQVLCIVNTRKHAQAIYHLLPKESSFHLSTLMTPEHRSAVLQEIRERLSAGAACHVISTSLIEAGVDVDFPEVWREEAGLDSILQAAGRCNREGKRKIDESKVHIFKADGKGLQAIAQNVAAMEYAKDAGYAFDSYETIGRYFNFLHELRAEQLDTAKVIEKCMRFEFKTVAETFHLIDNDMVPIYIPNAENAGLIAQIHAGELSRGLLRRLGRSSVNVYKEHLQNLYEAGVVENCNGIWILSDITAYDKECGLSLNKDAGAALWI